MPPCSSAIAAPRLNVGPNDGPAPAPGTGRLRLDQVTLRDCGHASPATGPAPTTVTPLRFAPPQPPRATEPGQAFAPIGPGMIVAAWMPQHPHYRRPLQPWVPPPPQNKQCQHSRAEWFVEFFNKHDAEADIQTEFANAEEHVAHGTWEGNTLFAMCCSARDTFSIPWHPTNGTTLYGMMLNRPDLSIQWHNVSSGGYSLCIGCANCSSKTGRYQPQNEMDRLGWNPEHLTPKQLKQAPGVRRAFRAFLAEVLGEPHLDPGPTSMPALTC